MGPRAAPFLPSIPHISPPPPVYAVNNQPRYALYNIKKWNRNYHYLKWYWLGKPGSPAYCISNLWIAFSKAGDSLGLKYTSCLPARQSMHGLQVWGCMVPRCQTSDVWASSLQIPPPILAPPPRAPTAKCDFAWKKNPTLIHINY